MIESGINVIIRCRPINKRESYEGLHKSVELSESHIRVSRPRIQQGETLI